MESAWRDGGDWRNAGIGTRPRDARGDEPACGRWPRHRGVRPHHARRGTPVSYTHLRAHETPEHLVCRLLLEKKKKNFFFFFFNDTATTEIYTRSLVGSVRCV